MEGGDKSTASAATSIRRPRRLWLWFAGGFLIAFVGMLLMVRMMVMHSSGQYAVEVTLWQHYADALPRLFGTSTLGRRVRTVRLFRKPLCFTCCCRRPLAARRRPLGGAS
jgi:hypothetical protein